MSNLILTGIDDSPPSTPFAWLPPLRDRIDLRTRDERITAAQLRTLGAAWQLVAIMADLLPQTKGLNSFDEEDFHDLAMMISASYRKRNDSASVARGIMWSDIAMDTRTGDFHDRTLRARICSHAHFLAIVVNILLTLPQAGRVPRELVPLFVVTATGLSGDLAMLTEEV